MRITLGGDIFRTDEIRPIDIARKIAPTTPTSRPIVCQSMSSTTGGTTLTLGGAKPVSVATLKGAHESWFPSFMEGEPSL